MRSFSNMPFINDSPTSAGWGEIDGGVERGPVSSIDPYTSSAASGIERGMSGAAQPLLRTLKLEGFPQIFSSPASLHPVGP